jgi:hypothetical protein
VIVTYMIPSRCIAIVQGEHVSSLAMMSKGEKKCGKQIGKDATMVCLVACSVGKVAVQVESAECSSSGSSRSRLPSMPKGEIVGIFIDRRCRQRVCH